MRTSAARMWLGTLLTFLLIGLLPGTGPAIARSAPTGVAPDGPGALSHFDLARKDCLGTARSSGSKVWFTVANGVLSDVYYPTVDATNVETLQYIVTDGASFTDLQTRDMTYTVRALGAGGMACRVTTTASSGSYRLVTDYLTDPARNSVVLRTTYVPLMEAANDYQLYLRFDPTVNGNGGGGPGDGGPDTGTVDTSSGHPILVASDPVAVTNAVNRDYGQPVSIALDASEGFPQTTNGFAGEGSDGLTQLDLDHRLTATYTDAVLGNVVQTARVSFEPGHAFTVGLGFGSTQAEAVKTVEGSLGADYPTILASYQRGWARYDAALNPPADRLPGLAAGRVRALKAAYFLNANVIKASEDKTFAGAIVASLASPWGQSVPAGDPDHTFFGSYREVFARDVYEAWTGLLADGDLATARAAVLFLFHQQQMPDGSMPRNSLLNGQPADDSFGIQLDEAAYPILMAYQLGITDPDLYRNHIRAAANFIAGHGPSFGVERWEEQEGYAPSTIAAEIAGLVAAADLATVNGDARSAAVWRGVADDWQRSVKGWTVTTKGSIARHPYFIRLSKTGDPNTHITYYVGNGGPTLDQRRVVDAGFLELVRLGELPAGDPTVLESLPVVDRALEDVTRSGAGWHRYSGDSYGDRSSGGEPWFPTATGNGHLWPILSAERAQHDLAIGNTAAAVALLDGMARSASGVGSIPEQVWEGALLPASPFGSDPVKASIGFRNGRPAGSAAPLTWSAGAFVRLFAQIRTGQALDRPAATYERYVAHTQRRAALAVTDPPDRTVVTRSSVTVDGSTEPGNTIYVAATNTDANSATRILTATAGPDGSFAMALPVAPGTNVLNVVAVSPTGRTGHDRRTIVYDVPPGEVLLDASDPSGDDSGAGTYAYPTYDGFVPGAFDIERFQVLDDGTNAIFRVQVRDLAPTFGNPLGAQLVDVYVHDPNADPGDTSTAASFPQRNYEIAPAAAWSRLIEVQGFGQRYVDAHGATLGTVSITANDISRWITFSVPKDSLGQPGPDWGFTVVLTGQDGFSPDLARGFAPTPQQYLFGVCAGPGPDPHCQADPLTVPKAIDVVPPVGVLQSDELDYIAHPTVTLQDVTI